MRVEPRGSRIGIGAAAVVVGALTALVDPGPPADVALLGAAVALLAAGMWTPWLPSPLVVLAVVVPVVPAVSGGQLEQGLFLAALLGLVVAWYETSAVRAAVGGVLLVLAPLAAWQLLPPREDFGVLSWVLGVAFALVSGRLVRRQLDLTARLQEAQRELAAQAVAQERRRIARDVHDLVGHGLAAVLLHLTGARHVLRRDVDAADAALAEAEAAGRRSMAELRTTMTLLRRDDLRASDEPGTGAPVPGLDGIAALVAEAASAGLTVEHRTEGDLAAARPGTALAAHRIVAEALANARRHAPRAATSVRVTATGDALTVEVVSSGPVAPPAADGRPRYGLVGMRERAETVGGSLTAGPVPDGWRVRAELPIRGRG